MIDYLNNLFDQIEPATAYIILTVSAFVENTFPPIPGDTVTVLGAYLVSTGKLGFWGVYFSTTIGSIIGFFVMFMMGKLFGRSFMRSKFRSRIFNESQIAKVELWFANYGLWVIVANRFLAGTRSVVSLFAGLFHLDWKAVLLLSSVSAFIWNGLLIYGGYMLGVNWAALSGIISRYNEVVIVITILVIIWIVFKKIKKRLAKQQESI